MEERINLEDVAFRNQIEPLTKECVVDIVCSVLGVEKDVVYTRQRDSLVRPVVAQMLCKFAGMTQRDVAGELNLKSGVAVSCQLRKLHKVLAEDEALKRAVENISEKLDNERRK
ncbi:MAG: hypothetical protein PF904_21720 [Kiritimatiellae bacterium]|jgi:hypothetical protein|nr:hypothetical protein [Kiritimatiellia bacterium]